jgi:hypothetical protein
MRAKITHLAAALLCFGVTGASAEGVQSSAPEQITIVYTFTGQTSNGRRGTFTASGLVCQTGAFVETQTPIGSSTTQTCDDGSGQFEELLGDGGATCCGGPGSRASFRSADR